MGTQITNANTITAVCKDISDIMERKEEGDKMGWRNL